ncbi:MAG TPA: phosphoenolpyruvate--protein phosphotransferase, partial [Terriglobales bacterium]
ILARSFGIPTIVGVKDALLALPARCEAVVDANRGFVVLDVTPEVGRFYQRELDTLRRRGATLSRFANLRAATTDGQPLEVAANVSSGEEVIAAFERGADAVGLFRTEILLSARESLLSEVQQFEIYAQAARAAGGRPVIIRTLDVGGDKPLPQLNLPRETNPFLGFRGIRIYPEHRELFRAQLRAIVRASAVGRVWLMAPMVSSLSEVLWLRSEIAEVHDELRAENIPFDPAMPVGMMIEVPSVAFVIEQLCTELDFFSIGTNDLSQYFFAVDRDNPRVRKLSNVAQPSFLRLLKQIVGEVHKYGKWIGMCGEMAGDIRCLPLLVALGLDEISVPSSEIAALKERIARLSASNCRELFTSTSQCRDPHEVIALLQRVSLVTHESPLLDPELIIFSSQSETKEEVIREIVDTFFIAGRTADPEGVEEAVWKRESVYSTGLGYGFAIPHCKTDAVSSGCLAILKLQKPVEWGSLDGAPVRIVILLALRETDTSIRHMQVFAKLARKLMDEHFRDELQRFDDADEILNLMSNELEIAR